jgi:hypothetical protein
MHAAVACCMCCKQLQLNSAFVMLIKNQESGFIEKTCRQVKYNFFSGKTGLIIENVPVWESKSVTIQI